MTTRPAAHASKRSASGVEGCDDGNTTGDDGCSTDCQLESCGNGTVDSGETCDDGNQSNDDDCPDDNTAGGTCQAAQCGDGFVWSGTEECDDGNRDRGDECDSDCTIPTTAFRITQLTLADPCLAAGCSLNGAANDPIKAAIEEDDPAAPDGSLDLNILILMKPLDQSVPGNVATTLTEGECTPPHPGASCTQGEAAVPVSLTATNDDSGNCFDPDATAGGSAEPINPVAPGDFGCFATEAADFTLVLGTLPVPLQAAQVFAQYDANPATEITGVLKGFLTGDAAAFAIIPPDIVLIGGQPLTVLFGVAGTGVETGPDGVTPGWWVHVNFTAEAVPFNGGASCGNGVLDDGD